MNSSFQCQIPCSCNFHWNRNFWANTFLLNAGIEVHGTCQYIDICFRQHIFLRSCILSCIVVHSASSMLSHDSLKPNYHFCTEDSWSLRDSWTWIPACKLQCIVCRLKFEIKQTFVAVEINLRRFTSSFCILSHRWWLSASFFTTRCALKILSTLTPESSKELLQDFLLFVIFFPHSYLLGAIHFPLLAHTGLQVATKGNKLLKFIKSSKLLIFNLTQTSRQLFESFVLWILNRPLFVDTVDVQNCFSFWKFVFRSTSCVTLCRRTFQCACSWSFAVCWALLGW